MKLFLLIITFLVVHLNLSFGFGDSDFYEERVWTHATSGKTITARMVDCSTDKKRIKLFTKDKKIHWSSVEHFSKEDALYIDQWVKKGDYLTVKLVELVDNSGSVSNLNTIEIIAKAGHYELEVRIKNDRDYEYFYKSKRLKPGETKTFTVKVPDKYTVEAYHGDKLMESETSGKKSGLSGSGL